MLIEIPLAFASNRSGGFGGYDLYTIRYENGIWQAPLNMGSDINSSHDERFPYLAVDQSSFYFSSNRPYCFGGFDIYHATWSDNRLNISNMGSTINSAGDDLGFSICKDGNMAVFYSDRKSGYGGFDSYFAYMQNNPFNGYSDSLDLTFVQDYFNAVNYEKINLEKTKIDTVINSSQKTDALQADVVPTGNEPIIVEEANDFVPIKAPVGLEYTILYQDKQDLLNDINKAKLDHWVSYLKENTDRNLKLLPIRIILNRAYRNLYNTTP